MTKNQNPPYNWDELSLDQIRFAMMELPEIEKRFRGQEISILNDLPQEEQMLFYKTAKTMQSVLQKRFGPACMSEFDRAVAENEQYWIDQQAVLATRNLLPQIAEEIDRKGEHSLSEEDVNLWSETLEHQANLIYEFQTMVHAEMDEEDERLESEQEYFESLEGRFLKTKRSGPKKI